MGGPKALVRVGGQTLLERHLARLHEAGCVDLAAVVRTADAPAARAATGHLPFAIALVAADTASQAASLVAALRRLRLAPGDALVVTPVDLLPPRAETLLALAAALDVPSAGAPEPPLAVTPTHRGRGGHPAVVRAVVLAPYLRGETPPLRDVLSELARGRRRLEVDDPSIAGDFDEPTDLPRGADRGSREPAGAAPSRARH